MHRDVWTPVSSSEEVAGRAIEEVGEENGRF